MLVSSPSMAYGDYGLLPDKSFNNAKSPKYDGYQNGIASMVYKFFASMFCKYFDKKTSGGTVKVEIISTKELAEELCKPIFRTFKNRKVHSPSIDNICGAGLADMQLISKFNKYLVLKYAWVIPLKDKGISITNAFQKVLDESIHKLNKIWVGKGGEFHNRSMKLFL